jgi:hypothetical protein
MKYAPYSFSKLSTHKQCNRKFRYTYIDKLKKDVLKSSALIKGDTIHSILECYPEKSNHKLAQQFEPIVHNFVKSSLGKKYLEQASIKEMKFALTKDLQPTEYSKKDAMFRGFIDCICVIDKTLNLIDWKTGKYKDIKYQDFDQLAFYSIYFFQRYPDISKIKISFVYVEHDDLENDIILERQYLGQYIDQLLTLISNVEEDVQYKKNINKLCHWCDFKTYCDTDAS